ncbi:MAG: diguanylate cyclase [Candidatus Hydrogenedens sp.]|nr:diguanylate cyclase [Candidatus Hydrogenedens sp.]
MNRARTSGVSVAIWIAALALGEYIARVEYAADQSALENRVLSEASELRASIESELNSSIHLASGLSGFLSLNPDLTQIDTNSMLASIYEHGRNVQNIGLAPNNRIDYIYPLEGNEAALGLDFKTVPDQWIGVQQAMETHDTVIVGPIRLVQGGIGIVTRTPVYMGDGSYWGLISIVIDVERLFDTVSKRYADRGIRWAIRTMGGTGRMSPMEFGDEGLFDAAPIIQTIELPGALWDIAIARPAEWERLESRLQITRAVYIVVCTIIALLLFLAIRERELVQHLALHDPLTGLPNRRLLFDRLEQCAAMSRRSKEGFCLLYVDLDDFKKVNDSFGHHAGDAVLTELAERFRKALRASDTIARVGGDEFVLLLRDTPSVKGAREVASKVMVAATQPIPYPPHNLQVGASIGIARFPDHGYTPDELTARADRAMYEVKQSGKGGITLLR